MSTNGTTEPMNEYEKARFYVDLFRGMKRRGYDMSPIRDIKVLQVADLTLDEMQELEDEYM